MAVYGCRFTLHSALKSNTVWSHEILTEELASPLREKIFKNFGFEILIYL
jgi:hypothetical protein